MRKDVSPSADILRETAVDDAGIRHAFGMPAARCSGTIRRLRRAGIVSCSSRPRERGGFMAEGQSHLPRRAGLLVTIGWGRARSMRQRGENAREDSRAEIVITGCLDAARAQGYTQQVADRAASSRAWPRRASPWVAEGRRGPSADRASPPPRTPAGAGAHRPADPMSPTAARRGPRPALRHRPAMARRPPRGPRSTRCRPLVRGGAAPG